MTTTVAPVVPVVIDADDDQAWAVAERLLGWAGGAPMVSVSQSALAGAVGLTPRTLRRVVDRLLAAGWVSVVSAATPNSPAVYDVSMLEAAGVEPAADGPDDGPGAGLVAEGGPAVARVVGEADLAQVRVGEHLLVPPGLLDGSGPNLPRGGDLRLSEEFLASCAGGIDHELSAWVDLAGALVVDDGHRRLAAALRLGLDLVPVHVVEQESEVDRLAFQLRANDAHEHNPASSRALACSQMVLMGASSAQLAGAGLSRPERSAARALAGNEVVRRRAAEVGPGVDLLVLGALAEVDDGSEGARLVVDRALAEIEREPLRAQWVVEEARRAVDRRRCVRAREDELRAQGVRVLDRSPRVHEPEEPAQHLELLDLSGMGVCYDDEDLTTEDLVVAHAACPGHCARVLFDYSADEDLDGARRTSTVWFCSDWRAHGHRLFSDADDAAEAEEDAGARQEAERIAAEREAWEQRRAEHVEAVRVVGAVRRRWVRQSLLARRVLPSRALHVVSVVLLDAGAAHLSAYEQAGARVLGVEPGWVEPGPASAAARALLTSVACRLEGLLSPDLWDLAEVGSVVSGLARVWLRSCEAWGHRLSDVERDLCETVEACEGVALYGIPAPRTAEPAPEGGEDATDVVGAGAEAVDGGGAA